MAKRKKLFTRERSGRPMVPEECEGEKEKIKN